MAIRVLATLAKAGKERLRAGSGMRRGLPSLLLLTLLVGATSFRSEPATRNTSEELRLLRRYKRTRDPAALDLLVERFLPLAHALARRYWRGRQPLEDLFQIAGMGLVKAIERFDPARGVAFSAYAVPTILGELKRYFRDSSRPLYVPQRIQENAMQINHAADELRRRLGRSPSAREIAEATGLELRAVIEAAQAVLACDTLSLESARTTAGQEPGSSYAETVGYLDEHYEQIEYMEMIAPTLKALTPRERLILHLRFVEDLTQAQIANEIGLSQMHVSRLLRRSLARLRAVANANVPANAVPARARLNGAAANDRGQAAGAAG